MREHESQELPLAAVSLGWLTGKDKQHPLSDTRGGQHAGAWAINALGALRARSRFCSPTPLLESACNARIARYVLFAACLGCWAHGRIHATTHTASTLLPNSMDGYAWVPQWPLKTRICQGGAALHADCEHQPHSLRDSPKAMGWAWLSPELQKAASACTARLGKLL